MTRKASLCKRLFSFVICIFVLLSLGNTYAMTAVANSVDVVPDISLGATFVLALDATGSLYVWGNRGLIDGQDGTLSEHPTEITVTGVAFTAISAGQDHAMALSSTGTVYTWGVDNNSGELGRNATGNYYVPGAVTIPDNKKIVAISAGNQFSLALAADGSVYAWGDNNKGQLGVEKLDESGSQKITSQPIQIPDITARSIYAGDQNALAIDHDGGVWMWGNTGNKDFIDSSTSKPHLPTKKIFSGHFASSAVIADQRATMLTLDGEIFSLGYNDMGQFGNGTSNANQSTGVFHADNQAQLKNNADQYIEAKELAIGTDHTVALTKDGEVYTWGGYGTELGYDAGGTDVLTPRKVTIDLETDDHITNISAKGRATAAVDSSGFVWVWGDHTLYDGYTSTATPTYLTNSDDSRFCLGSAPQIDIYNTSVTANVTIPAPTYTVSIPASMDLGDLRQRDADDATKIHSKPFTVSVSNVGLLFGEKQIKISVKTADNSFVLKDTADSTKTLAYEVYASSTGGTALAHGGTLGTFTADGSVTGRIQIDQSNITRKGEYSGSLLFDITVEERGA